MSLSSKRALSLKTSLCLRLYGAAWMASTPFLGLSPRLRKGWSERLGGPGLASSVDVWIQAASAGEAYLALEVARGLTRRGVLRVHVTSWTAQGMEVIEREGGVKPGARSSSEGLTASFFPFDGPGRMKRVLTGLRPGVLILLETELWPGLLAACREGGTPVLILNGRLSERSLRSYHCAASLLKELRPTEIYAVSREDASRYAHLFGPEDVHLMNNIKFDRIRFHPPDAAGLLAVDRILPAGTPFVVLGSVRKEEEEDVFKAATAVLGASPGAVLGLFPRHMHRVGAWEKRLREKTLPWTRRSELSAPVRPGTLILWDRFGELGEAYGRANAAFVGGSLYPCGGQNFLEPLSWGVAPCVGPFRDNFAWVGNEIFTLGLAKEVRDGNDLARSLCRDLAKPEARRAVLQRAEAYVRERRGGTETACATIMAHLGASVRSRGSGR